MRRLLFCAIYFLSFNILAHGFEAGTPVKVPDGRAAIDTLSAGDLVMSCDVMNRCVPARITAIGVNRVSEHFEVKIDGEAIRTSSDQKFNLDGEWVKTSALNRSARITDSRGGTVSIVEARLIKRPLDLYWLTVEENHNFYVGESEVLAHNVFFLIPFIPLLAWGGGAGIAVGVGAGTAATIATVATTVAVGVGVGVAVHEISKHSNSPSSTYSMPIDGINRHFQQMQQQYAPDRNLPNQGKNKPIPDVDDAAHTQLGTRGKGAGYQQTREWGVDGSGKAYPVRDTDRTDHGTPQYHPNPHQHDWTSNPDGSHKRGDPKPVNPSKAPK